MPTFNDIYNKFLSNVYLNDMESQDLYLDIVAKYRKVPIEYLKHRRAVFIPNNEYISFYGGSDITSYQFDLYRNGYCRWIHFMLLPIIDLTGSIVGVTGWDLENKARAEDGEQGLPMYATSSKICFNKSDYFITDIDVIRENFKYSTIFVVDGIFDHLQLNNLGIPAISLMGSSLSKAHIFFLRWFKRIFVVCDNDTAGINLYQKIRTAVPNTYSVMQNQYKDIDDYIKNNPEHSKMVFTEILKSESKMNFNISINKNLIFSNK